MCRQFRDSALHGGQQYPRPIAFDTRPAGKNAIRLVIPGASIRSQATSRQWRVSPSRSTTISVDSGLWG
jgi:hypothetical protein